MVSASDFQPEGRWFTPGLCHRVVSFHKKHCSTLALSLPRCLNGTGDIMLGGNLVMD